MHWIACKTQKNTYTTAVKAWMFELIVTLTDGSRHHRKKMIPVRVMEDKIHSLPLCKNVLNNVSDNNISL